MKDNIELLNGILTRFRFSEPASIEVRQHIREIKSGQFKKILKRTGKYGFIFGLVSGLFFILKKCGINITIVKSAAIIVLSASIAAISIGTGTYFIVKSISMHKIGGTKQIEEQIQDTRIETKIGKKEIKSEVTDKTERSINIDNRISIQDFSSENADESLAERITDKIYNKLLTLRGSDYAIKAGKEKDHKKSGMMLKGSLEFLNGIYSIKAKVIDVRTLKILFYSSEQFTYPDNIDEACAKIAERIQASPDVPKIHEP